MGGVRDQVLAAGIKSAFEQGEGSPCIERKEASAGDPDP